MGSGLYLYDVGYVVPYASDERFIPEIIRICNSENVQLILVGVDAEVAVFSKFKDLIETKTKAKIVSSSEELTETFTDKFETYNYFLARNKLFQPQLFRKISRKREIFVAKSVSQL